MTTPDPRDPTLPPGLLDELLDPFVVLDADWRYTFVNRRAADLMGVSARELVGELLWERFPEARTTRLGDEYRHVMTTREPRQFEVFLPGLSRWEEVRVFPWGTGIAVNFRDVTRFRQDVERRDSLLDLTRALADASGEQDLVRAALQVGLPALGAFAGAILMSVQDGESLEVAHALGYQDHVVNRWPHVPVATPLPACTSVREGRALFLAAADLARDYPLHVDVKDPRTRAVASLPLVVEGAPVGVLALSFSHDPAFDEGERGFALSFAGALAQALTRVRTVEAERRRTEHLGFLARAGQELSGTRDPEEVLERIAALAVPGLADWCTVRLPTPDGLLSLRALRHVDAERTEMVRRFDERFPVRTDDARGAGLVFRTREPLLISHLPEQQLTDYASGEHLDVLRAVRLGSVIVVPLVAGGACLGILSFVSHTPGRYGPPDLAFAMELARRAASALENAELHRSLEEERARLSAVLDQLPVGVILSEIPSVRILTANRVLGPLLPSALFHDDGVERYGEFTLLRVDGSPYAAEDRPLARTVRAGEVVQDELVRVAVPGGSVRVMSVSSAPVLSRDGEPILAVATVVDVTGRAHAEQTVRELNASLDARVRERTAQLEALITDLDAFTYSVSHDLRSPVRHMAGFAGLLRRALDQGNVEQARRHVGVIEQAAGRMNDLIDGLLTFARSAQEPLERQMLDLEALVGEIRLDLEQDLGDRRLTWNVGVLPRVEADPRLLRQVLVNLLGNAVKYTRRREEAHVRIHAEVLPDEVRVHVADNGEGFDPRYAERLFKVFQRLHRADDFEGDGVGLSTVKRIVARHGGRVWAESRPGEGATFSFSLPHRAPS